MESLNELVNEILRLCDEQTRALQDRLSPEEAAIFASRKERIYELLERMQALLDAE